MTLSHERVTPIAPLEESARTGRKVSLTMRKVHEYKSGRHVYTPTEVMSDQGHGRAMGRLLATARACAVLNPAAVAECLFRGAWDTPFGALVLWCFVLNPHRRSPYPNSQLELRDKLRVSSPATYIGLTESCYFPPFSVFRSWTVCVHLREYPLHRTV